MNGMPVLTEPAQCAALSDYLYCFEGMHQSRTQLNIRYVKDLHNSQLLATLADTSGHISVMATVTILWTVTVMTRTLWYFACALMV